MSFISIIEKIGHEILKGVEVASEIGIKIAPVVTTLNPPVGTALSIVCNTIIQIEQLIPVPKSGSVKKQIATEIIKLNLPQGTISDDQLSKSIDAIVVLLNILANKTWIKVL